MQIRSKAAADDLLAMMIGVWHLLILGHTGGRDSFSYSREWELWWSRKKWVIGKCILGSSAFKPGSFGSKNKNPLLLPMALIKLGCLPRLWLISKKRRTISQPGKLWYNTVARLEELFFLLLSLMSRNEISDTSHRTTRLINSSAVGSSAFFPFLFLCLTFVLSGAASNLVFPFSFQYKRRFLHGASYFKFE